MNYLAGVLLGFVWGVLLGLHATSLIDRIFAARKRRLLRNLPVHARYRVVEEVTRRVIHDCPATTKAEPLRYYDGPICAKCGERHPEEFIKAERAIK